MKRRLWIGGAAVVAVVFLVAYFASPLVALHSLRTAAREGDRDALEAKVDFPSVRESLKAQFNAAMLTEMRSDPEMANNPFAGLGMMLAPALVGQMVDTLVTPDALAALLTTAKRPDASDPDPSPAAAPSSEEDETDVSYRYQGLDRFRATLRNEADPNAEIALIMERRGLFAWKLVRIDMEKALAASSGGSAP